MRSMFSAGILDCLLERGIRIPNVLAVSAGACAGMNYVSGQRERILKAIVEPLASYKYLGAGTFLRKGTFFDMDYLFDEVPANLAPYDFAALQAFEGKFQTSTVNCETGELFYYDRFESEEQFFRICKAANSLPVLAGITWIGGAPMLDGGMADAIPIGRALEQGWEKIIVVLTRSRDYRKKEKGDFYASVVRLLYRKYPLFLKQVKQRAARYNQALELIERLEREGRAFVYRPGALKLKNRECDIEELKRYYRHGQEEALARMAELEAFLEL